MAGPGGGPGSPDHTVMGPACNQGLQDGEGKEAKLWYGKTYVRRIKERNIYLMQKPFIFLSPLKILSRLRTCSSQNSRWIVHNAVGQDPQFRHDKKV